MAKDVPAGIYARISDDREGRALGVERQVEDCRSLCARLNWSVVDVYIDNDISASRASRKARPAYARMLADIDAGRIRAIASYSSGRLTRRPMESEAIIDRADRGLLVANVAAGAVDLRTASGRMVARILAAADAREAEENSERSKRERQQRAERGHWNGGPRPFGWRTDGVTPVPVEQELIKWSAQAVLDGKPIRAIAREWERVAPRIPRVDLSWHPWTVRNVLTNPRVAGMLPDERPAVWDGALEEGQWRAVRAVLKDPDRITSLGEVRLLTGIATCGVLVDGKPCGATLQAGQRTRGKGTPAERRIPGYICSSRPHLHRGSQVVDDWVTEILLVDLAGRDIRSVPDGTPAAALADRSDEIRVLKAEAADAYAEREIDRGQLARITARLEAELRQVQARMLAVSAVSVLADAPITLDDLEAWWETIGIERQRRIVRARVASCVVHSPGKGHKDFDPATVQVVLA